MPAQPLSSLRKMVGLTIAPYAVSESSLGHMPMQVIATWAGVDNLQTSIIAHLLKSEHSAIHAMLMALKSTDGRRAAIEALVKSLAPEADYDLYSAIQLASKPSRKQRNAFAHNIWAVSPQIEDALILIDAGALSTFHLESHVYDTKQATEERYQEWAKEVSSGVPPSKAKIGTAPQLDYRQMFVYKFADFQEAIYDAGTALQNHVLLSHVFNHDSDLSDRARQQLNSQSPVRAAIQKIRRERNR